MKRLFSLLFLACLLLACSKDGEIGPLGPQGPQGEQGEQGPAGQVGEPGTVNVIYSEWLPSPFTGFDQGNSFATGSIDAPELTAEIENQGAVLVYGKSSSGGISWALPFVSVRDNQNYWFGPDTKGDATTIQLRVESLDSGAFGEELLLKEFRYILVPGGVIASGKSSLYEDKMSYEEITERFNIPE